MCRLLDRKILKDTKKNRMKNDCPSQCDKTHCDVCQFTDNKEVVTIKELSPELYGKDLYYQVESINPKRELMKSKESRLNQIAQGYR